MTDEAQLPGPAKPKRKRKPRRLPRPLHEAEAVALLKAASSERDRLVLLTGMLCGLRVSEITGLEVPDLDLDAGQLLVREGKGQKDRTVPIPTRLVAPLRQWIGSRTLGYVFASPRGGGRLTTRALQKMIKRVAVQAGLPEAETARRFHMHRLRHTYGTNLHESGASLLEIRDLLGHASVSTAQIYTLASARRLRSAAERMAESFPADEKANGKSEHPEAPHV